MDTNGPLCLLPDTLLAHKDRPGPLSKRLQPLNASSRLLEFAVDNHIVIDSLSSPS